MTPKKEYYERYCVICGKSFTPKRSNQVTCASTKCKKARTRQQQIRWHKENHEKSLEINRNYMRRIREKTPAKKDTIVAIGYADRQREKTLAMVGKVKVEL